LTDEKDAPSRYFMPRRGWACRKSLIRKRDQALSICLLKDIVSNQTGSAKISKKRSLSATQVGSSVVEDRQVELAEALGVGDHVDLDDLTARDREGCATGLEHSAVGPLYN
jgi:hypothetical protein